MLLSRHYMYTLHFSSFEVFHYCRSYIKLWRVFAIALLTCNLHTQQTSSSSRVRVDVIADSITYVQQYFKLSISVC